MPEQTCGTGRKDKRPEESYYSKGYRKVTCPIKYCTNQGLYVLFNAFICYWVLIFIKKRGRGHKQGGRNKQVSGDEKFGVVRNEFSLECVELVSIL